MYKRKKEIYSRCIHIAEERIPESCVEAREAVRVETHILVLIGANRHVRVLAVNGKHMDIDCGEV